MKKISIFIAVAVILVGCTTAKLGEGWLTNVMDSSADQLVRKVDHDYDGNVIIIGAGAAGLAAGNLLKTNGVAFVILEATDHHGGRIQENTSFADFPIDIGAEWIHQHQEILNRLMGKDKDAELPIELIRYNPSNVYDWDGEYYEKASATKTRLGQWAYPEYKFKDTTWYQFLDQNFAQNIVGKIIYNTPVVKIDYSGDDVIVTSKDGRSFTANKVISTVSVGVLNSGYIRFAPELSKEKSKAFQSVEFLPGFKLFMKFSDKFYPDMIGVDTQNGEKTYYDVAYKKEAKDKVLGLLSTGISAEAYYDLGSEEEIVSAALAELDNIFDGKASASYTGKYLFKDWGRTQFTLGTWTHDFTDEDLEELVSQPLQNKVYFAGESFDIYGQTSTVHGAMISGYTAVYQILGEEN